MGSGAIAMSIHSAPGSALTLRNRSFAWGERTYLMAILNVTPDSFSDGGEFDRLETAVVQAKKVVAAGADILDIGGQSTRPGATQVTLAEELRRVVPTIQALRSGCNDDNLAVLPISVDTTRAAVARAAVEAGADLINDISGATFDPEMLSTAAELGVPIVLMHSRGTPQTMQQLTDYGDLMGEIYGFLEERIGAAIAANIPLTRIIIDPGIGFAKTWKQNLEILRHLDRLRPLGCPILVGPSRKSFIGHILDRSDPKARIWGTAAACSAAIATAVDILRLHDIEPMHDVCRVSDAIFRHRASEII